MLRPPRPSRAAGVRAGLWVGEATNEVSYGRLFCVAAVALCGLSMCAGRSGLCV